LALATEAGDVPTALSSNVVLARARYGLGDYHLAIETAQRNDALLLRPDDPHGPRNVTFARIWSVLSMAEIGTFAEGVRTGEDILSAAVAHGRRHEEVWARLGLGRLYVVQGAWERAIAILEPSLPLCETSSDLAVYFSRTASSLGEAYVRSGRIAEGMLSSSARPPTRRRSASPTARPSSSACWARDASSPATRPAPASAPSGHSADASPRERGRGDRHAISGTRRDRHRRRARHWRRHGRSLRARGCAGGCAGSRRPRR